MSFPFPWQSYFDKMFVFFCGWEFPRTQRKNSPFISFSLVYAYVVDSFSVCLSVCLFVDRIFVLFCLVVTKWGAQVGRRKKKLEEGLLLYVCRTLCFDVGNVAPVRCSSSLSTLGHFFSFTPRRWEFSLRDRNDFQLRRDERTLTFFRPLK